MAEAAPLDTDIAIETPEHIVFRLRVAGPARRFFAYALDVVLCYGALALGVVALGLAVFGTGGLARELTGAAKAAGGLFLVLLFVVQWGYFVVWEAKTGKTPGKSAVGLVVVTTSGRPIDARAAILRNLLRVADFLPTGYLVGACSMALSSRFQRLGDLVAGTMVVFAERPSAATPLVLVPPVTRDEQRQLPEHVRLDEEERAAIELFLRRRGRLGTARERELAQLYAAPLGARLGVVHPDPARLLALLYDRAGSSAHHARRP